MYELCWAHIVCIPIIIAWVCFLSTFVSSCMVMHIGMNDVHVCVHVNMLIGIHAQLYVSVCITMSVYEYIVSLTSRCTSGCLCTCVHLHISVCANVYVVISGYMCVYIWDPTSVCHVCSLSHWVWESACPWTCGSMPECMYTCVCEWMCVIHGHYVMWMCAMNVHLCLRVNECADVGPSAMWVCIAISVPVHRVSVGICACAGLMVCMWEREREIWP